MSNDVQTGKDLTNYCSGCTSCANICPSGALTIERNKEGFKSYKYNSDKCIKCGLCING